MKIALALLAAVICASLGCSSGKAGGGVHPDGSATGSGGVGAGGSSGSGGAGPSGGASGAPVGSGGGSGLAGMSATGGSPSASGGASAPGGAAGKDDTGGAAGGVASGGANASGGAGGAGGGAPGGGGASQPLGMNDVTILVPLPQAGAEPVLFKGADLADDGSALVSHALFDRVATDAVTGKPLGGFDTVYARLQLVAVRFDLCDRHLPGPCPDSEDGRMRLVFQPVSTQGSADDIGFHAFYAIPNAELAGVIRALRALAASNVPPDGILRVSPALGGANPQAYAAKVRALVKHYGGDASLVRLTMNARSLTSAAFVWALRGVEKKAGAFVDIPIVGSSTEIVQSATLVGSVGFETKPVADTPTGLSGVLTELKFDALDATAKRAAMTALVAVDNPLMNTAETVPCVACHVATVVMRARAASSAIDPSTLPGRYTSTFDLSVAGGVSASTTFTIRALGYSGAQTMISQRVVNETAQTLTEIEQRYPGP